MRSSVDAARALYWARPRRSRQAGARGAFVLRTTSIFGPLVTDDDLRPSLEALGGSWHRREQVYDQRGADIASIWGNDAGAIFLPFDPNELIQHYWQERYIELVGSQIGRRARSAARRAYYRLRPAIPRSVQIGARRLYSRRQSRRSFPKWPIETSLHDLYELLFGFVGELIDEPLPIISLWPLAYRWAFVLSHDVETAEGYQHIALLREIEALRNYRSAWNFVPRNHQVVADSVFDQLRADGCEIGVHGLYHDGRDIEEIDERLPVISRYAAEWQAVGFRSPATLRDWTAMSRLPFDYDSTYSDTAPYEPQPGGCGSLLPYMIENVVELPITLPQDHTLFEILGGLDGRIWIEKARFIRDRGGMALTITHPDYALNERLTQAYGALLAEFEDDNTAWKALPAEVSTWWRRRGASTLARANGGWHVVGPASEVGSVTLIQPRA